MDYADHPRTQGLSCTMAVVPGNESIKPLPRSPLFRNPVTADLMDTQVSRLLRF